MSEIILQNSNLALTAELQSAADYADAALSKNTKIMYSSAWRQYVAWCQGVDADGLARQFDPYGPRGQIALYLAWLADSGVKATTISMALSAISKAFEMAELPAPRADRAVKLVFAGVCNKLSVAPEQVDAILPHHLRAMVDALLALDKCALRSLQRRAMLVVCWVGGMRRSELVALTCADVQAVPEGLKVTIRRSKTDQAGKGRVIALPYSMHLETCPVRTLDSWLKASEITEGPIFRTIAADGKTLKPYAISGRHFANIVQRCVKLAGIEGNFSGHSPRAGLVTAAVRAGKDLKDIQAQTGHKTTDMLYRYVREQALFKSSPSAGLI